MTDAIREHPAKRVVELEAEAAEYKQDGEQWKAAHDESIEREQALAAHVERMREDLEDEWSYTHSESCSNMDDCASFGFSRNCCHERPKSLDEAHETSLARRDALMKAEALEEMLPAMTDLTDRAEIRSAADNYRHQAEDPHHD